MTATPPRFESIEIPERPSPASGRRPAGGRPRRVLIWGAIAAVAVIVLAVIGLRWSGSGGKTVPGPDAAPLIKAEEGTIKMSPDSPGGMDVPNRDIMIYGRIHGAPGSKPPVERLLPEPEQPLTPPPPRAVEPPPVAAAPGEAGEPGEPGEPGGTSSPILEPAPAPRPAGSGPSAAVTAPTRTPTPTPAPAPAHKAPAPTVKPQAVVRGRYQVQLFAGRSAEEAGVAWNKLRDKNGDVLGPLAPIFARADLGERGTFWRLRAGPLASEAKAKAVCAALAGRGSPCIVIRPGK